VLLPLDRERPRTGSYEITDRVARYVLLADEDPVHGRRRLQRDAVLTTSPATIASEGVAPA
jgi:hypothetical protein